MKEENVVLLNKAENEMNEFIFLGFWNKRNVWNPLENLFNGCYDGCWTFPFIAASIYRPSISWQCCRTDQNYVYIKNRSRKQHKVITKCSPLTNVVILLLRVFSMFILSIWHSVCAFSFSYTFLLRLCSNASVTATQCQCSHFTYSTHNYHCTAHVCIWMCIVCQTVCIRQSRWKVSCTFWISPEVWSLKNSSLYTNSAVCFMVWVK